jgi:hypothetical protein
MVFLEPLYKGGLDAVIPGSSCIANAYTSNHDRGNRYRLEVRHGLAGNQRFDPRDQLLQESKDREGTLCTTIGVERFHVGSLFFDQGVDVVGKSLSPVIGHFEPHSGSSSPGLRCSMLSEVCHRRRD